MTSAKDPVERGCWLMYSPMSHSFYVVTARRPVGRGIFEVVGKKQDLDTQQVLSAVASYHSRQVEIAQEEA